MGRQRFVKPETERYDLTDGDWIELKKHLTAGEELSIARDSFKAVRRGESANDQPSVEIDMQAWRLAKLVVWTTDWSFEGLDRRRTKPSWETFSALDMATIREIEAVLELHIERYEGPTPAAPTTETETAATASPTTENSSS